MCPEWKMAGNIKRQTNQQEGQGLDGRTILEQILKKQMSVQGIELIRLRIGITGEPFESNIELQGPLSHGAFSRFLRSQSHISYNFSKLLFLRA